MIVCSYFDKRANYFFSFNIININIREQHCAVFQFVYEIVINFVFYEGFLLLACGLRKKKRNTKMNYMQEEIKGVQ